MTTSHSTRRCAQSNSKPERPEGSPLFWHPSGRWCKKIRGKQYYFGRGAHGDALAEYERQKDDLHSGRLVRDDQPDGLTIYLLTAKFLTTKKHLRDAGELSPHTFNDYAIIAKLLIKHLGRNRLVSDLRPEDFEKLRVKMSKTWGPVRLGNTINKIRIFFNYAIKSGLIEKLPVFGEGFRRPSKKALRQHKQQQGAKMFEAHELRAVLQKATLPLRAMILLGVNCGFGNSDIGSLPLSAVDLERGWIDFARAKTAIPRRIPLWVETVEALRQWLALRPAPAKEEFAGLMFLTSKGGCWNKSTSDNPVSKETAKLLKAVKLNGHRNFYALRHSFQTVADESGDFIAVRKIMGHASSDIADVYRERISDARLLAVTGHVRGWLFPEPTKASGDELPDVIAFQGKTA